MKQIPEAVASDRKYIVPAVERAILILRLLQHERDGLTNSEIAQQLSIPKSTAFTILETLRQYGLIQRDDDTGQFRLGMELFILGSTVIEHLDLRETARPILKELAAETDLTAHLGVLDSQEVVYVEKIESQARIKVSSRVGGRMGVHCTALGKAMLAHLPEREARRMLDGSVLPRRTPNTITAHELLQSELARTKDRGYAVDYEENEIGIRCLSAPVYNRHGEVTGAISVSGPRDQISSERIDQLAEKVVAASQNLSERLGYVAPE